MLYCLHQRGSIGRIHVGFGGKETIHNVNKIFNNKILLYYLFQMNVLIYKKNLKIS